MQYCSAKTMRQFAMTVPCFPIGFYENVFKARTRAKKWKVTFNAGKTKDLISVVFGGGTTNSVPSQSDSIFQEIHTYFLGWCDGALA